MSTSDAARVGRTSEERGGNARGWSLDRALLWGGRKENLKKDELALPAEEASCRAAPRKAC